MKNYLNKALIKIKKVYFYYKELSHYTQKQSRFRIINFLNLITYIIFEEVSIFLKLKLRIMNELEAHQLIEKAQKYINREITVEVIDENNFGKKKKITGIFSKTGIVSVSEVLGENIVPLGKLVDLNNPLKYEPVSLSSIIKAFEKLDEKK